MGKLGIKINKGVFKKGQEAFKEGGDFDNVQLPGGKYTVAFVKGRAVDTKNGPSVVLDFKVGKEHDEYAGQRGSIFFSLEEERVVWLFRALGKLGFEVDELDEDRLSEILDEIEENKPVARLRCKENDDFSNYYIDKLLDGESADDILPDGEAESGEEKEDEGEEEEESEDDLADKDRDELKAIIEEEELDVTVKKSMDDDALREAIKEAREAKGENEEEEEEEEEEKDEKEEGDGDGERVELKVGDKVTATIRGKDQECKVKKIDEKSGKITVTLKDKTEVKVTAEQIMA